MSAKRSAAKGIYRRGLLWLDHDRRADGSLRTPNLAIFWYDPEQGRIRSATTRTADVDAAKKALDERYLTTTRGAAICPTCGQPRQASRGHLLLDAISNYQIMRGDHASSAEAIRARLGHVVAYIATLPSAAVTCEDVNEDWVARFRRWNMAQPIVSPTGKHRKRSAGTVEASVVQLAAAINAAHRRQDTVFAAAFKPIPAVQVSHTPRHRLTIEDLAAGFHYATAEPHRKDRANLLRFMRVSVATMARPDAAYDVSTAPERAQWDSARRILSLNPKGRRQTKKYRATIVVPRQFAPHLDDTAGFYVPIKSVRSAWEAMCAALGWPGGGESGMKLLRRSMGQLVRDRGVPDGQLELQMGHRRLSSVTDLYAAFRPEYLSGVTEAIEAVVDDLERMAPGAFHRSFTGDTGTVVPLIGRPSRRKVA